MIRCRLSPVLRTVANSRSCSRTPSEDAEETEAGKIASFGEAFKKLESFREINSEPKKEKEPPFATLLRNSKFVKLGNPEKKILVGKVYNVFENDIYVDFGGKFPAICKRPARSAIDIVPGTFVRIRLLDMEIASRFLGAEQDLSLLEADATLLGIAHGAKNIDL
ncbi:28S ribosomal protein S28, mitochondrial [Galendromus occidentalis]|uniref:28S ribosomal protein S28, mitochondrial n=1 Tax=Galendromus occidentalis TaxID=34638 RepID=A0AAJ6W018_9ACAR|nr:28S ribosomal protein S28, mitochondrial [Galendromus occidentalis]